MGCTCTKTTSPQQYQPSFITEPVGVFPPGVLVGSVGDWLQPEDSEEDVPAPELQDFLSSTSPHAQRGKISWGPFCAPTV